MRKPIIGAIAAAMALAPMALAQQVFIYPKAGQSQQQQDRDKYECHTWAVQNSGFDPTFYNDVWRSTDGVAWTQMTANAGWDTRAGLRAVTFRNEIYIFGGSQNDDEAIVEIGDPPVRILYNDVWKSADGTAPRSANASTAIGSAAIRAAHANPAA